MKVKKGFVAYLLIFLALILAAVVICAAILVLSPKAVILGFDYNSEKSSSTIEEFAGGIGYSKEFLQKNIVGVDGKTYTQSEYDKLGTEAPAVATETKLLEEYSKIVIKTNVLNVTVMRKVGAANTISFEREVNFAGFFRVKDNENAFIENCELITDAENLDNNQVVYSYFVPTGLVFSCSGKIVVNYPYAVNKIVEIETTTGNVDIGGVTPTYSDYVVEEFTSHNLSVKTTKGSVVLRDVYSTSQQHLDVETTTGPITIQSKLNAISNLEISLKTVSGQINFAKQKDGGDLTIKAKSLKITSNNSIINLGTVSCQVEFLGDSGKLYAKNLENGLDCKDTVTHTNFDINEIGGQFLLSNGKYNDIKIGKTSAFVNIVNEKGIIEIGEASAAIWINSSSGSVKLSNCSYYVNAKTTSGSIEFSKSSARFDIETTSGKVFGTIVDVVGGADKPSKITSKSGVIDVQIDQQEVFVLKTKGDKGVDVKLAGKEYTNTALVSNVINGTNATNELILTTGGNISVSNYAVE